MRTNYTGEIDAIGKEIRDVSENGRCMGDEL